MTAVLVNAGVLVIEAVLRVDLKAVFSRVHGGDEFDTAVRLLSNSWRGAAGVVTWIILWVIVLLPWQFLSAFFHTSQPRVARAIADVGGSLMTFVVAGFCLYMLRMAVALTLAQRETDRALHQVEDAVSGRGQFSTRPPQGLMAVAVWLTTPTDIDFLGEALIAALVLWALVGNAHNDGFPL